MHLISIFARIFGYLDARRIDSLIDFVINKQSKYHSGGQYKIGLQRERGGGESRVDGIQTVTSNRKTGSEIEKEQKKMEKE